jgi:hypothetical protein
LPSDLDNLRQAFDQRIERPRVAGEITADELGLGRRIAPIVDDERHLPAFRCIERAERGRVGTHARAAGQHMRVAMREDQQFAGVDPHRLATDDTGVTVPLDDKVICDQVFGAGQYFCEDHLARGLFGNPRPLCRAIKEDRAGEANGLQHVG